MNKLSICMYFQVHQPFRIRRYSFFDIGKQTNYFESLEDKTSNRKIFRKVAEKSYLPTNKLILKILKKHPEVRLSYSLSGVFLEQAREFYPEVIESFQKLVKTGQVEILEETYYHSLSFLYSKDEFISQIKLHRDLMQETFGVTPKVFRNTELIYSDYIGDIVNELGYKAILTEGAEKILEWRSPNFIYKAKNSNLKILLKNYKLSDDIAFRFSDKGWIEHPLTASKYAHWLGENIGNSDVMNLFMDYETFGEHQWEDTGIFNFLEEFPREALKNHNIEFVTPSEAIQKHQTVSELSIPEYISWADTERDLSAWKSNAIQNDALEKLYSLEKEIINSKDIDLIHDWRRLTTSDHFYYMCTKWFNDGDVHKYFNPYDSPYEAFIAFMNVINDLQLRLRSKN